MPKMIMAYNTKTGKKIAIPENWIGHPTLGKYLKLTPMTKRRSKSKKIELVAETVEAQQETHTKEESNDA